MTKSDANHWLRFLLGFIFVINYLLPLGAQARKAPMKLKYIELEHTNPSMGPHETVRTITLKNDAQHEKEIDRFLSETKLFDKVVLKAYLAAELGKNTAVIKIVTDEVRRADTSSMNEGATISNLLFAFENGPTVSLHDLRYYVMTGYGKGFFPYMVKNGLTHDSSSDHDFQSMLRKDDTIKELRDHEPETTTIKDEPKKK